MKKCSICLFVTVAFFAVSISGIRDNSAQKIYAINATSMVTIEADSGRVLYESNPRKRLPMASTTKIVTAITVIENCDVNDEVKIDDKAVGVEGSSIYLQYGETLKVIDLLHGLMLQSGNDCAVALAIYTAGSVEKFAQMMNDLAKKVGVSESNFVNPHGLHNDNHYTTAYDLAMISAYAMKNDIFKKIVGTKSYRMPYHGKDYDRVFSNKNKILFNFDGGNGIKTGFTKKAGRCLVASAERNGMMVISVVLNCPSMFEDCAALMEKAFNEYENSLIIEKNTEIARTNVINGELDTVALYCKKEFKYPLTKGEKSRLVIDINLMEQTAPIKKDKVAGKITIKLDNQLLFEEKLYNIYNVDSVSVLDKVREMLDNWSN